MPRLNFFKQSAAPAAAPAAPSQPTVEQLSKSMCDRKAVHWAMESARMSGSAMSPAEQHAMSAAEAWLKNPSAQTKAAAAEAALKAGHGSPAAWAAQAAAWASHGESAKIVSLAAVGKGGRAAAMSAGEKVALGQIGAHAPGGGSLAGAAVSGAVSLAAAMKVGAKLPTVIKTAAAGVAAKKPAMPAPPSEAELAKTAEIHKPFVELGQKILADKSIKC